MPDAVVLSDDSEDDKTESEQGSSGEESEEFEEVDTVFSSCVSLFNVPTTVQRH